MQYKDDFMAYVSSEAFCEITTKLRRTGELSDGRIILDDGSEFKIHKILLATGSGYFNMLFSWHKDQKDFHLKELVSKEAMEQILSWIGTKIYLIGGVKEGWTL